MQRAARGLVLCLCLLAQAAWAEGLTRSPWPVPRPGGVVVTVPNLPSGMRPQPRPAGVSADVAEQTSAPQPTRTTKKGSVCGNPEIKGTNAKPIASRTKGCSVKAPVLVTAVSGVTLSEPATITCETAEALNTWVKKGAQPAFGGQIAQLQVVDSYACRPRNNVRGNKISAHGAGLAIDIAGFVLRSGKIYTVLHDYGRAIKAAQKAACGIFHTTLGPGSDGYHENHLHFDIAPYRGNPYCR